MIEALAIKIGASLVPVTEEAFKRKDELPVTFELVTTPRFVNLAEKAEKEPEEFKRQINSMIDDLANEFREKLRRVVHIYTGLDGSKPLAGMKNLAGIQVPFGTLPINLHFFGSVVKKAEASIADIREGKLEECRMESSDPVVPQPEASSPP